MNKLNFQFFGGPPGKLLDVRRLAFRKLSSHSGQGGGTGNACSSLSSGLDFFHQWYLCNHASSKLSVQKSNSKLVISRPEGALRTPLRAPFVRRPMCTRTAFSPSGLWCNFAGALRKPCCAIGWMQFYVARPLLARSMAYVPLPRHLLNLTWTRFAFASG